MDAYYTDSSASALMSAGEMYEQDFPSHPDYSWLAAHDDNSLPAEYEQEEDSDEHFPTEVAR